VYVSKSCTAVKPIPQLPRENSRWSIVRSRDSNALHTALLNLIIVSAQSHVVPSDIHCPHKPLPHRLSKRTLLEKLDTRFLFRTHPHITTRLTSRQDHRSKRPQALRSFPSLPGIGVFDFFAPSRLLPCLLEEPLVHRYSLEQRASESNLHLHPLQRPSPFRGRTDKNRQEQTPLIGNGHSLKTNVGGPDER
jgi:hypothetical protein